MDKEEKLNNNKLENINELLYTCQCGSHQLQLLSTRTDTINKKYILLLVCLQCGFFQHVDLSIDSPTKNVASTITNQQQKKDNYIG